ncbi:hypothetical protein GCM10023185_09880 [Hymenobacter saemangeumensis]|uniref:DUF3307 domain-containing protein n=1 Tax=Hymenobacter saemangeumensis TaxID=1084522 RepID=A0ABP8I4P2_9BACT
MTEHPAFYLGLSLLLMHEMDAVRCREWRIFPGMSLLSDEWGKRVFFLAHVPLFYAILAAVAGQTSHPDFISGMSLFMVVHAGLHLVFLRHPRNEFTDWLSWSIIGGAAAAGALELGLG